MESAAVEERPVVADTADAGATPGLGGEAPERTARLDAAPVAATHLDGRPVDTGDAARHRSRRGGRLRLGLRIAAVLMVLASAYYLVSLYQVWSTGRAEEARPVDAIVVLGAAQYDGRPSPQLAARLDHVVELWPAGYADLVVVTGGKLPLDRFTEAEASAAYLVERGVPADAIALENAGATTYESLAGVAELLAARGLDEVVIVTDPYHALRSRLIAEEVGLTAWVSPTPTSVVTGGASVRRHLGEAGGVAFGRLFSFERLSGLTG